MTKKRFRRILILSCLLIIGLWTDSMSAPDTYRVFLQNKGISPFIKGSELYQQTEKLFTQRSLKRRAKVLAQDSLFSIVDAPLYQPYLDDIERIGAKILLKLRWKNYVVVSCDSTVLTKLKAKPYVLGATSTGELFKTFGHEDGELDADPVETNFFTLDSACGAFNYGPSLTQNLMLHSNEFHSMGELGQNTLLGILDNGFRWQAHDCYQRLRRVAEYDFAFQDSVTANDSLDVPNQDNHGTNTLSVITGFFPDSLIGIAPYVNVVLAKTEDMRFERRIEEDNYAAAIEWMDILGVDVTSSSIGYGQFDSTQISYSYSDLDGHSTICDAALNRATAVGMVCVTAAGNSGGTSRTLISPGDADSAITVGAYDNDSLVVAGFTSKGPNGAGTLKPNVATLGTGVIVCGLENRHAIGRATGTSFATPAVAGGVALLLSQFPALRPYEVRQLLQASASQATSPDSSVGYGLPNVMKAAETYGILCSPALSYASPRYQYFTVYLRSMFSIQKASLFARIDGGAFQEYLLQPTTVAHQFVCRVPFGNKGQLIEYYISADDGQRQRRQPAQDQDSILAGDERIPCGLNPTDFASSVPDLSIENNQSSQAVAFGTPYIQLHSDHSEIQEVQMYNNIGQVQSIQHPDVQAPRVDLLGLQPGLYFLTLKRHSGSSYHTILIY